MSQELLVRMNKLLAQAADCEIIADLDTNPQRRAAALRLAERSRLMAERVRRQIDKRKLN